MALPLFALFCLVVPNGIFIYWLFTEFNGIASVISDRLAIAFIIEAFLVMILFTFYFARRPPGKFKWPWFVVLSLVGGIGFGIPFYWWLNRREKA